MSYEEHPVDALLKIESLQRTILSRNIIWSDYPDVLVRAKFVNALPREYDFQKQMLNSQEGGVSREAIVTVKQDR